MAYTKQQWIDNQTPLDASHMNHIEEGIYEVVNDLETTNTNLTNLETNIQTQINELDGNDIVYDNTTSGLQAANVQSAIDEIKNSLPTVQSGFIPAAEISPNINNYKEVQVTFPKPFNETPSVVATMNVGNTNAVNLFIFVRSVSTTGFTVRVRNSNTATGTAYSVNVNWVAVGK